MKLAYFEILGGIGIIADGFLNIKNILDILFKVTKKSANILADIYLLKDVSTISKWKNNKIIIKSDDINKIVQFAVKESSVVQRKMIREEIEALIINSGLNDSIKEMLFNIDDFGKFIEEALNVSTSLCDNVSEFGNKNSLLKGVYGDKKSFSRHIGSCNDEDGIPVDLDKAGEGEYSGVMKFDLFLTRNKKNKYESGNGKPGIKLKRDIDLINRSKTGSIRKYIGVQAVFSIILLSVVLNFTIFQPGNSSKNTGHTVYIKPQPTEVKVTEVKATEVKATAPAKEKNAPVKKEPTAAPHNRPEGKKAEKPVTKSTQISDEQNINVDLEINNSSNLNIGIGKDIYITRDSSASSATSIPAPTASETNLH